MLQLHLKSMPSPNAMLRLLKTLPSTSKSLDEMLILEHKRARESNVALDTIQCMVFGKTRAGSARLMH